MTRRLCLLGLIAFAAASRGNATGEISLRLANPKAEKLAGDLLHAEGPAWMPEGYLLFGDTTRNRMMKFDERQGLSVFREPCGRATGLWLDTEGRLVVAESHGTDGGRCLSRLERDGTWKALVSQFDGHRFNSPNDLTIDARGRIYFTDPRYSRRETMELSHESVYRLDPDGSVERIVTTLKRPNGIHITSDGRTLYVADNASADGVAQVWAFDVSTSGGVGGGRMIFDFGGGRGIDGMTLDTEGRIWAAGGTREKAGIYVFEVNALRTRAHVAAFIQLPEDPTNCTFGGADGQALYVTTTASLYRIQTTVRGRNSLPRK